jgi:NAD kinase
LSQLDTAIAEPIQAELDAQVSKVDALEAQVLELESAAGVEKKTPLPDDLPEAVVKALADSDERVAKAEKQAAVAEAKADAVTEARQTERSEERAAELVAVLGDVGESAPVLKALAQADPEAWAFVDDKLGSLILMKEFNELLKVHGDDAATGSAVDKIAAYAVEIRKEDKEMTVVQARAQAWRDHPELKDQAREEGDG